MLRIMTSVRRLRQERDMLHQTVCCTDTFNLQQISDGVHRCVQVGGGGEITWYSLMQEWRSMVQYREVLPTQSYCMQCVRSVPFLLSSNNAMLLLLLAERARQLTFWNDRQRRLFHHTFGHPTVQIWTNSTTKYGKKRSSESTKFMTSMNWSSA